MESKLKYDDLKSRIDFAYPVKKREQEKFLVEFWRDFNKNVRELEGIARKDFSDTLKDIDLNGADVLGFKVKYSPEFKHLDIKITKWKSPTGVIIKDGPRKFPSSYVCPHSTLAPILGFMGDSPDSSITQFKQKYGINTIRDPDNDCNHN